MSREENSIEKEPAKGPAPVWVRVVRTLAICSLLLVCFVVYGNVRAARARNAGILSACKSNLKNIGTALEMYSTDWSGKYPETLALLTPNYLKTIPECITHGIDTYSNAYRTGPEAPGNTNSYTDYYRICCSKGHPNHGVPAGYPAYDGVQGLIEKP